MPILSSLVASIGVHLADLVRPWRTLTVSSVDLVVNVVNLLIITRLLRAGRYLDITGAPEDAETPSSSSLCATSSGRC